MFHAAIALQLAAAASAQAPSRAAASDLFRYRSEAGRFHVELPAKSPSVDQMNGSKFAITGNDVRHTAFADGAEFAVEIHDIPRFAELVLTSHYILDRTVSGMLDDIGAREVASSEASLQGQSAREVAFEIPDRELTGKLLVVLAGNRLYLVSVRHSRAIDPPGAVSRFFESFSFWLE
jgi:hypothetical protein